MRIVVRQALNDVAQSLSYKTTGLYVEEETLTYQKFIPTETPTESQSEEFRSIFRTVVQTGTLATGANTVAHGLTPTATWHFVKIYGVIENTATPLWVPIPNDTILVTVDGTNINITIPAAYNNYDGRVVLEYVKED